MPLWRFYHPVDAYTPEDKQGIAETITEVYGRFLPKFYTGVVFQEITKENFYIGGVPQTNFVRVTVDHIARTLDTPEARKAHMLRITDFLKPWITDRGFDWELHVDETPFDLWTIQGYLPPRQGTEDEKRWKAENRPSPRTHD